MDVDLTEEELCEFKTAFHKFDPDNSGKIELKDLENVLKSLGQKPTEQELADMIEEIESEGGGQALELHEFLNLMARKMHDQDTEDELLESFKILLDQNGKISVSELRYLFSTMGEKMNDDEIDEVMSTMKHTFDENGFVNYQEFVKHIAPK